MPNYLTVLVSTAALIAMPAMAKEPSPSVKIETPFSIGSGTKIAPRLVLTADMGKKAKSGLFNGIGYVVDGGTVCRFLGKNGW